ncbi:MAG: winged helix-turn-helix domain-containing protein, partial [Smithellaceae bacterium]
TRGTKYSWTCFPLRKSEIFIDSLLGVHVHLFNYKSTHQPDEPEIYQMFKDLFQEPWYQETVSNGVPRWQHNIAWAKERAKRKGLIKRPDDSGRGYWELTATGMKAN